MTAWSTILDIAEGEEELLSHALANARTTQLELLHSVITANSDTAFGRQHGFSGIRSIADFRSAVPIRSYDDMRPWIDEMADGASNVLTGAPVIAWEETGGSSGGTKLIPYTEAGLRGFRAAVLPSLSDLARRRPGIASGHIYAAISPAMRQPRILGGGVPLGVSDAAYLGNDVIPSFASVLAVPPQVGEIADFAAWQAETLRHLKACTDLSIVSVWSPTFWLELCKDISPEEVQRLWPKLDTISCWTHGVSASFVPLLQEAFPGVHIERKGLLSTEGAMTMAHGAGDACVPALRSCFLEWIDAGGYAHLTHELEPGVTYRVVITTWGGLYRYDTHDLVTCTSREGQLTRLVFVGRAGMTSDMVGEKLEDAFVASALACLPAPARLVAAEIPSPHYELWLDILGDQSSAKWLMQVESALCRNPQYAYARRVGQLKPLVQCCRPGFWNAFGSGTTRPGVAKASALQRLQPKISVPKVHG